MIKVHIYLPWMEYCVISQCSKIDISRRHEWFADEGHIQVTSRILMQLGLVGALHYGGYKP
jgi:hypothetical protein